MQRVLKYGIAIGPVAGIMGSQIAAQPNATGIRQATGTLTSAYSGYDVGSGTWQFQNMLIGYVPMFGAWLFGKVSGRVLR